MLKVQEQEAKESCLRLQIQKVNDKKQQQSLKMWWLFEDFEISLRLTVILCHDRKLQSCITFKKSETEPHALSEPHLVWKVEAKNRAFASICKILQSCLKVPKCEIFDPFFFNTNKSYMGW